MAMVTIRPAVPADLDSVVRLNAALFREDSGRRDATVDQGWPAREGAAYFGAMIGQADVRLLVADDGGAMVGYAAGRLRERSALSLSVDRDPGEHHRPPVGP